MHDYDRRGGQKGLQIDCEMYKLLHETKRHCPGQNGIIDRFHSHGQIYWNKKSFYITGLAWYTNMTAISLFLYSTEYGCRDVI